MILVPDASVAVKWAAEEEDSEKAARLLNGQHQLHVPRVFAAELANACGAKFVPANWPRIWWPGLWSQP